MHSITANAQWTARAIVGKPYRATPIFKSEMTYVVLNPTWTVPPGILRNDVLPKIRSDPGYLASHEMDVIDAAGNIVDPATVAWETVPARGFPYAIRQRAGAKNPLGRIKFMFPNPYAVYLHDTSAPELFGRAEHTFSSGCIRVENPVSLGEWVLKDSPQWNAATLEQAIGTGKTQTVLLAKPLTVMLLYWTVAFDGEWNPIFLRDVYKRDDAVLQALDAEFRFEPSARRSALIGAVRGGNALARRAPRFLAGGDELVGHRVLEDVAHVVHGLRAHLVGRHQLDVVEPDVGVQPARLRLAAQRPHAVGAGVVGSEREQRLVDRRHRLVLVVGIDHPSHVLHACVDVGLDLRDVADAELLAGGRHDLHHADRADGALHASGRGAILGSPARPSA